MNEINIISKMKDVNLLGRGGANFPVWQKWQAVVDAKGEKKYIICNASEGEPDIFKDAFLFDNRANEVVAGIKIALETIHGSRAIIYLNHDYYNKYKKRLIEAIGKAPISLFLKHGGYLAGEETTVIATIEGKRQEPALKPPYPTEVGLYGCPTLMNNVETFYYVSQVAKDQYFNTRFYSISGDVSHPGVFEFSNNASLEEVLHQTKNWPPFDFFAQVGGGASGEIMLPAELNQPAKGAASIHVYNRKKTDPFTLLRRWASFFLAENCDKCVPCREGVYRINEMVNSKKLDQATLEEIFFVLEKASFCPLGRSVPAPFRSLIEKVINQKVDY